jgi:hypothetical protein
MEGLGRIFAEATFFEPGVWPIPVSFGCFDQEANGCEESHCSTKRESEGRDFEPDFLLNCREVRSDKEEDGENDGKLTQPAERVGCPAKLKPHPCFAGARERTYPRERNLTGNALWVTAQKPQNSEYKQPENGDAEFQVCGLTWK